MSVQIWAPGRNGHDFDTGAPEHLTYPLGEHRVAVEDEVSLAEQEAIDLVEQTTDHVHDPLLIGLGNDASDLDGAGLEVHDEQDVAAGETEGREDLDGEEVGGTDDAPVGLEKGRPLHGPLGRGVDAVLGEDAGDGAAADLVAEDGEVAADPGVAPGGVLGGKADDEVGDLRGGPWPTRTSALAAVVLVGDEPAITSASGYRG